MSPLANHLRILVQFLNSLPGKLTVAGGLLIIAINLLPAVISDPRLAAITNAAAIAISFLIAIYLIAYLRERTLFESKQAGAQETRALQQPPLKQKMS